MEPDSAYQNSYVRVHANFTDAGLIITSKQFGQIIHHTSLQINNKIILSYY
jgi:hypothetical protein